MAKKITLPKPQVFSLTLDTKNIRPEQIVEVDSRKGIFVGSVDFGEGNKELNVVRENGAQIVYATIGIEKLLEDLILIYFFGPFFGPDERRDFFVHNLLQSSSLEFAFKKELTLKIINKSSLLSGKKKSTLQTNLKNINVWRNAFAHGRLEHDNLSGSLVRYFSGTEQILRLDDEYWTTVENCFKETHSALKEAIDRLKQSTETGT